MTRVEYCASDGTETVIDVPDGISLMQAAVTGGIRGIVGECGGQLMCATCHVYVEESTAPLPDPVEDEVDMLELAAAPVEDCSRLSCQLKAGDSQARIRVRLPETQV